MNPKLTPELRRQYRDRLAASRAFSKELSDHEAGIAAMTTTKFSFDPLDDELEDCFNDGEGEGAAEDAPPRHYSGLPRTRSSALYHNSPEYDTGKPCIDQHYSPRETSSGRCVACMEEGQRDREWLAIHGIQGSRHRRSRRGSKGNGSGSH